jgi:hypothetical protein
VVGLRETLNNNSKITTGVTIALIVVVLGYIIYAGTGHGPGGSPAPAKDRVFYTDDDGATWFADDATKIPPFDHNGKQAVRARVYRCGGKTFVNHVERYTPEVQKRLQQAQARSAGGGDVVAAEVAGIEIKSPGEERWVNANDPAATKIMHPKCSGGDLELVLP